MQPPHDLMMTELFYQFLKKSYKLLTHSHQDYLKVLKQIERDFLEIVPHGSENHLNNQMTLLRNSLLPWIIDFPKSHNEMIWQQLQANHTELNSILKIVGANEIQHFISMKIAEITPHLISILGLCLQMLREHHSDEMAPFTFDQQPLKEQLTRDFYYPLIQAQFKQCYITRMNNHYHDLDRAILQTPKNLNQLTNNLNALKMELNNFIYMNDVIKLRWQLSRDLYELVEDFSDAIGALDFNLALNIITHFHCMWIADSDRLGGFYPVIEAYIGSVVSWLSIYTLAVQLAWFSHYAHETTLGMSLLSISIGLKLTDQAGFGNGFFKYPRTSKMTTRRRKKKVF